MSKHFSANQYEGAFKSSHLQNWQVPKSRIEQRPQKYEGYSVFLSDDRGYLLNNATRSKESPWGSFIGTWDMPTKIPGNNILNATSRHPSSANSLKHMKEEFEQKLKSIPVAEDSSNQSTKKTDEQKCCSSTDNAEVLTKAVPDSKPQTPMTPLSEIKGNESPSLNKVTVPTPLGLQDTNVCMRSVGTSSRQSIRRKTSSKQGADLKKSEPVPPISDAETQVEIDPSNKPKTLLPDTGRSEFVEEPLVQCPVPPSEKRVVSCSPCQSQRCLGSARAQAKTINWPGPKSLSHRIVD